MRHLARYLFTLCSAMSLLLCVAACVLWWRSYVAPADWLEREVYPREEEVGRGSGLVTANGRFQVGRLGASRPIGLLPALGPGGATLRHLASDRVVSDLLPRQTAWRWLGFEEQRGRLIVFAEPVPETRIWEPTLEEPYRIWFIPAWGVALPLAVLPALWLHRFRIRRRRASHLRRLLCRACGYDLRATPEGCPECGAVPPPGRTVNGAPEGGG